MNNFGNQFNQLTEKVWFIIKSFSLICEWISIICEWVQPINWKSLIHKQIIQLFITSDFSLKDLGQRNDFSFSWIRHRSNISFTIAHTKLNNLAKSMNKLFSLINKQIIWWTILTKYIESSRCKLFSLNYDWIILWTNSLNELKRSNL